MWRFDTFVISPNKLLNEQSLVIVTYAKVMLINHIFELILLIEYTTKITND